MLKTIIRKEHKNNWEKRAPLTPAAVKALTQKGFVIEVEPCDVRIYSDADYVAAGAVLSTRPQQAEFVIGIKEPPVESIQPGQVHIAFSHTIKGQPYNMPLLRKFIDSNATLIDYETIVDKAGKRTIAFGRFAGIAGAVDSFHTLGRKFAGKNLSSPLTGIQQSYTYGTVDTLRESLQTLDLQQGEPVRVVIVGSGNVGKGSEEVCQWLGLPKVKARDILDGKLPEGSWYGVLSSRHLHKRKDGGEFDFRDFAERGRDGYISTFDEVLGGFNLLLQTPYWTARYPRHLDAGRMQANKDRLPLVIGDISCDIDGSIAATQRISDIDNPAFTYLVDEERVVDGISWLGVTVMAIDNLPCELPIDASGHFSRKLVDYAPEIMKIDLEQPLEYCGLGDELRSAVIVYKGELTPDYEYLNDKLRQAS